jgi:outer membrane autotransporter protein
LDFWPDFEEEFDETNWDDISFGTIAMDVGAVVNVNGGLFANIVSLNTDIDAGIVNIYNNAWIEGNIHRANVFVNPGSEKETVNMYGRLSLSNSVLDIGTNTLNFHSKGEAFSIKYGENFAEAFSNEGVNFNDTELNINGFLYLDNSTIITHIDLEKNTNGIINVEQLEFGDNPSLVKVVIDDGVLNPQGATFDFLTGDTNIGNNLIFSNVMYDITYDNGQLTLVPNGNSGIISLDALNDRLAATGWLSNDFATGSKAKMIADALNEWAQTDPEAFKRAIKQIQPDTTSSQQTTTQSTNNQIVNAVETHMGHGNAHHGHNGGHHDNGHHNGGHGPHMGRSGGDAFSNTSVWAQGLYNKSKLNTTNGFTGDTYGFALGSDTEISKNLNLGLGYAYTNSDINTESRDTDVESHTAILYGQYDFGNAFVNGITTYGFSRYEEESGIKTAKYDMDSIFAQATTGYNFDINSLGLTPQAGIRYLWTNTHSYTDSAEQYISANKTNTLTGVFGTSASMNLQSGSVILQPSVKALATYDMMKDADDVIVRLANGSNYIVSDSKSNRLGAEFGVGLNVNYNAFDLSLNYGIEVRENYTSQTGMLRAKYNF